MSHIQPMVISIWCGNTSKPTDLNGYLRPFVAELDDLLNNGILINNHHVEIKFHSCICDAPARAFIKGLKTNFKQNNAILLKNCDKI